MEKWELAYKDYQNGMKYKDIASKYDVALSTVKSWKTRKWNDTPKVATSKKSTRTKKEKVAYKKNAPKAIEELNANDELTDKQKLFCLYYLQSFNAAQSYIKAYGCTYETAMVEGSRSLRNPKIKAELDRLRIELQSEQYFTIQDIINEYAKQAFSDIKNIATFGTESVEMEDGSERELSFVRLKQSNEVDGTLVQEVKQGKDGVSAKLWDKQKAMAELVKLMPDGNSNGGNITIVDVWNDADE